jgi:hypothetical protein
MEQLNDMALDMMFASLLSEQTRLMSEMKNNQDTFRDSELLHNQITTLMKALLKFKATRTKIRNRMDN